MQTERIKQLQRFYEEDPDDPFNLYALALEYLKTDTLKSEALFEALLNRHPDYLPTYYHAAKRYQESGEKQKAVHVYEKGILVAQKLQDTKALRELKSAYEEMMFE